MFLEFSYIPKEKQYELLCSYLQNIALNSLSFA